MNTSRQKTLNIVMLTTVSFHRSKGGTEKVMIDTANAMTARGHRVSIIFRDKNGSTPGFSLDSRVHLLNCATSPTPFWLSSGFCELRAFSFSNTERNRKKTLLNLKTLASRFKSAIENTPADIFISYDPRLSAMLVHELKIQRPVITTFQFNPQHIIRRYNFQTIKHLIAKAGPIQVLLPEYIIPIKEEIPEAKCFAIPNVVASLGEQATLKNRVILNVSRVVPLKNQLQIVRAMKLVSELYPDWVVKIFGETETRPDYAQQIRNEIKLNALQKNIELCGTTNNVLKELLQASIYIHPSTTEGFPLAIAEAMSAGLRNNMACPCPGCRHVIRSFRRSTGSIGKKDPADSVKHILHTLLPTVSRGSEDQRSERLPDGAPHGLLDAELPHGSPVTERIRQEEKSHGKQHPFDRVLFFFFPRESVFLYRKRRSFRLFM